MNNTKWFQNPEMVIALSALLIGLVTAAVSIYSAYIDREYAKASVWPRLEIFRNTQSDSFAYQVLNSGTGPAIIQYAKVEHKEMSMKTWSDVFNFSGVVQSHIGNRIIPPQGNVTPLYYNGKNTPKFIELDESVSITLCYCSIYSECWLINRENIPQPIEQCSISEHNKFSQ